MSTLKYREEAFDRQPQPRIVVLTGAGISAESGISTFRDADGLWEQHRIEDVASPQGFARDPELVHRFYDARRAQLKDVYPNAAHWALSRLQVVFPGSVTIITQNVDDLHEQAMSSDILHIHGRLRSALCTACGHRFEYHDDLAQRPPCPRCDQHALRPDIVWFGEQIREADRIYKAIEQCDVFVVVGTSGSVQPAASFASMARAHGAETVLINLEPHDDGDAYDQVFAGLASRSVRHWVREFMLEHGGVEDDEERGRSVALEEGIRDFVDGSAYSAAVDEVDPIRTDAEALLEWLGIPEGNHSAKFELDAVVRDLTRSSGNCGEGGNLPLVIHDLSHLNDTRHLRDELMTKNIEHAADLIAWMVATRPDTGRWGETLRSQVP